MRKIISMAIMLVASIGSIVSCANNNSTTKNESENATNDSVMNKTLTDKKILVVFFSHTGENYGVGNISEGNTHIIAKMIGEVTGGTLFEIVPENDYPHDSYDAVVENVEKNTNDVYFDVELSDTEETIYESPVIPRGSHLEALTLDKELEAGTYDCVLTYHLIDEDQNTVSTLRMGLTVMVEN